MFRCCSNHPLLAIDKVLSGLLFLLSELKRSLFMPEINPTLLYCFLSVCETLSGQPFELGPSYSELTLFTIVFSGFQTSCSEGTLFLVWAEAIAWRFW